MQELNKKPNATLNSAAPHSGRKTERSKGMDRTGSKMVNGLLPKVSVCPLAANPTNHVKEMQAGKLNAPPLLVFPIIDIIHPLPALLPTLFANHNI